MTELNKYIIKKLGLSELDVKSIRKLEVNHNRFVPINNRAVSKFYHYFEVRTNENLVYIKKILKTDKKLKEFLCEI